MIEQSKKYYKVVRSWHNKLLSCTTHGIYECEYKLNVITKPKIGKLFVFDSLLNARNLLSSIIGSQYSSFTYRVYECEITNAESIDYLPTSFDSNINWFWEQVKSYDRKYQNNLWKSPHGTHGCDSVKLTKLIE